MQTQLRFTFLSQNGLAGIAYAPDLISLIKIIPFILEDPHKINLEMGSDRYGWKPAKDEDLRFLEDRVLGLGRDI